MAKEAVSRRAAPSTSVTNGNARLRLEGTRTRRRPRSAARTKGGPRPDLKILETRILRGPNYWSRAPVVRMLVDLGSLESFPSNTIPGFVDGLMALMPSLEDHACSLNRRGGFVTRPGADRDVRPGRVGNLAA